MYSKIMFDLANYKIKFAVNQQKWSDHFLQALDTRLINYLM